MCIKFRSILADLTSLVQFCVYMCVWGDDDDVELDAVNKKKIEEIGKWSNGKKTFDFVFYFN